MLPYLIKLSRCYLNKQNTFVTPLFLCSPKGKHIVPLCPFVRYLVYLLSYLPLTIFHNGCLSGPYLWKYKGDCNGTWFIDRWQWEEGQCTRTILIPSIFTVLSPHNHLFFIMDACPGHIFESTKEIEIKLGL